MPRINKNACERILLGLARVHPVAFVSHDLSLLKSKPARTDAQAYHIGPIHYYEPLRDFRNISNSQQTVQDVDLALFEQLQENDILFIDSSHIASVGSDVITNFFEILPRLKPGVWIHIHDIFFPVDYPADWVIERRIAFNEQYLLEAFLSSNTNFSVQLANYWLSLDYPSVVNALCPTSIRKKANDINDASSLWLKKEAKVAH